MQTCLDIFITVPEFFGFQCVLIEDPERMMRYIKEDRVFEIKLYFNKNICREDQLRHALLLDPAYDTLIIMRILDVDDILVEGKLKTLCMKIHREFIEETQ